MSNSLFIAALLSVGCFAANAQTLTCTFTFTGSGTLGTQSFTNAAVTITTVATSPTVVPGGINTVNNSSASIAVSGLGSFQFTSPTQVAETLSPPNTAPGTSVIESISFSAGGNIYAVQMNRSVINTNAWNLLSSLGPVNSSGVISAWDVFPVLTSGGRLNLYTNTSAQITFRSAFVGTPTVWSASPSNLNFTAQHAGPSPSAQTVQVTSQPTGLAAYWNSPASLPSWLKLNNAAGSGTTPLSLQVFVDPLLVPTVPGSYAAALQFFASSAVNAPVIASVSVTVVVSAPSTPTVTRSGVLAHVAAGGWWDTTLTLINTSSATITATVNFHNDDGSALSIPLRVTQQGASETISGPSVNVYIGANSTAVIATGALPDPTRVGWVDVSSSSRVYGFAILRSTPTNDKASEATVLLQTAFPSGATLPFDNTSGYVNGVAVVNLGTAATTITATVWDESGNQVGATQISLPGNGHTSFVLADKLSGTAGKRGYVQFQNPTAGISVLGLRFSPAGPFTDVPAIVQ